LIAAAAVTPAGTVPELTSCWPEISWMDCWMDSISFCT
jgi:hypothetical protein